MSLAQHQFATFVRLFLLRLTFTGLAFCAFASSTLSLAAQPMRAEYDEATGRVDLMEGDAVVLSYNYHTVSPPEGMLEKVQPNNLKYAQPRSDYIHPLFGPDGEILTDDWSPDHPHHRGIYWAWPEVDYKGERGDLHALQRVFSRPTGKVDVRSGDGFAEVEAENVWKWEDNTPIVREVVTIRAYPAENNGRFVDLKFCFTAIEEDVTLARRQTNLYGGVNVRLSPVRELEIVKQIDVQDATPRQAWADSIGIRRGGTQSVGVAIFPKATNSQYPGEWIDYPELPWLQPTFPTAGTRYTLKKGEPLVLEYRLWIRPGGKADEAEYSRQWRAYQDQHNKNGQDHDQHK